nr:hypothetical protein BaRGS_020313 [Batillaria attramentaria]
MLVWGVYHILFIVAMEILPRPLARCFEVVVQSTVKRGKVYDLERVRKDNDGYIADETSTDGTVTATRINDTSSVPYSDVTANKLPAKVNKEMSRDELKVKRAMLLFHYFVVSILTLALLFVAFLYTPPSD